MFEKKTVPFLFMDLAMNHIVSTASHNFIQQVSIIGSGLQNTSQFIPTTFIMIKAEPQKYIFTKKHPKHEIIHLLSLSTPENYKKPYTAELTL